MQIERHELQAVNGVGPALARAIIERWPTWAELSEAEAESMGAMRGMRTSAAAAIRELASARVLAEEVQETAAERTQARITKQERDETSEEEKYWVMQEIPLPSDPFTVVRRRVPLTPGVCNECGWDACAKWGLGEYETLPDAEKRRVREGVVKHKSIFHKNKRIISDAEFKSERKRELTVR